MPLLAAVIASSPPADPSLRPGILLGVILLTCLVSIALMLSLFWANRRMKMLGMRSTSAGKPKEAPDLVVPWAEAGRRLNHDDLPEWPDDNPWVDS